jgi:hypothetical protein
VIQGMSVTVRVFSVTVVRPTAPASL